jgi:hypothetical protein
MWCSSSTELLQALPCTIHTHPEKGQREELEVGVSTLKSSLQVAEAELDIELGKESRYHEPFHLSKSSWHSFLSVRKVQSHRNFVMMNHKKIVSSKSL